LRLWRVWALFIRTIVRPTEDGSQRAGTLCRLVEGTLRLPPPSVACRDFL